MLAVSAPNTQSLLDWQKRMNCLTFPTQIILTPWGLRNDIRGDNFFMSISWLPVLTLSY